MIRTRAYNTHPRLRANIKETLSLASSVLKKEGVRDAELTIVFISDGKMVNLNRQYLHHRYTTDVLSFPLQDEGKPGIEGEVYVNLDQARRQAKEYDVSFPDELRRLVVHGTLHLVGYTDDTQRGKRTMTRKEDSYLNNFKRT